MLAARRFELGELLIRRVSAGARLLQLSIESG
jgi:hypothetical protein